VFEAEAAGEGVEEEQARQFLPGQSLIATIAG
jgi:hypothetical protein